MDVTPQLIEQIEFAEKFRGYDPDEVDEFLERAGATIAQLANAVHEARSLAAADARAEARNEARALIDEAVQRAERAEEELRNIPSFPVSPAELSDEEEAALATRTLVLAKRTADAVMAEARESAGKMRDEAREAADADIADAKARAEDILATAATRSEAEFGHLRDKAIREINELEERRADCAHQIVAAEARLAQYRESLTSVHATLGAIVEDPTLLTAQPVEGFDADVLTEAREATRAVEVEAPTPSVDPVIGAPEARVVESSEDAEQHWPEAVAAEATNANVSEDAGFDGGFVGQAATVTADEAEPHRSGAHVNYGTGASWSEPRPAEPALPESAEERASGSWGPGSWSSLTAAESAASTADEAFTAAPAEARPDSFDRGELFADSSATTETSAVEPAPGASGFSDFPSSGLPVIGEDRYARDLGEAMNRDDASTDDAMTAFFEGDDSQQAKRFGRRR